jgi:hypothetical protein
VWDLPRGERTPVKQARAKSAERLGQRLLNLDAAAGKLLASARCRVVELTFDAAQLELDAQRAQLALADVLRVR